MDFTNAATRRRAHFERYLWLRKRMRTLETQGTWSERIGETQPLVEHDEAARGSTSSYDVEDASQKRNRD